MLLYYRLIIWEQHDGQIPWLAKRAHQTLDKTGIFNPNHRHTFRSDSQSFRFVIVENALLRQQLIVFNR
jgi:hypothetical protein